MISNPYDPPRKLDPPHELVKQASIEPPRPGTATKIVLLTLLVVVSSVGKWWLPVLLGTGGAYTFGWMIEEWILVLPIGLLCGLMHPKSGYWQPVVYFYFAYGMHLPFVDPGKFVLLYWGMGIAAVFIMYIAVLIGHLVLLVLYKNR